MHSIKFLVKISSEFGVIKKEKGPHHRVYQIEYEERISTRIHMRVGYIAFECTSSEGETNNLLFVSPLCCVAGSTK